MAEKLAVSVAEMAEMIGVSKPIAYEICRRNDFNGMFKIGKRTLVSVDRLREWIDKQVDIANT